MQVFRIQLFLYIISPLTIRSTNIRRHKLNMRCTYRFTPGTCADAVVPVWTFDFFALNCTERLGCYLSTISNRFRSYMQCTRSCRAFVDLYTQTLSEDDGQFKRLRSEIG
ncbi:PREDICTED: uncharacterized protein LOC106111430 isoform X1 [Papilio polytes]|uniref:uncharacterized protein LOC106111430 isoform X1 n=1 Tax=Papilio polytes TaxID=76194 RepID=UPI00067648C6|nr:PREDICTED: uncharacterized protein LOC106111430 isoform X1 [Papilio polytes]